MRIRVRLIRGFQVAARIAVLVIGRAFPVIGVNWLLDLLAPFGVTRPRRDRPHVVVAGYDDVLTVLGDHEAFAVSDYTRRMAVIGTFLLGREFTPAYLEEIAALRRAMPGGDADRVREIAGEGAANAI